jgi:hypothetical protein
MRRIVQLGRTYAGVFHVVKVELEHDGAAGHHGVTHAKPPTRTGVEHVPLVAREGVGVVDGRFPSGKAHAVEEEHLGVGVVRLRDERRHVVLVVQLDPPLRRSESRFLLSSASSALGPVRVDHDLLHLVGAVVAYWRTIARHDVQDAGASGSNGRSKNR